MMGFWSSKSGISSKYSYSSSPTFIAEPWNVYTGRLKSNSSSSIPRKVSVFIFDKKQFENYLLRYNIIKSRSSSHDKKLIQEGYDILRDQVNNLAKLKHPNILTLVEPLEEHSKNFIFVTEYVTGSLGTIFSSDDTDEQDFLKGHIKEDIVIQRGILQIVNALDFIHNKASSVHLSIDPNAVLINENSDWKVSGLGYLFKLPQGTNTADYYFPQYDPRTPRFMSLNLDYTAPELVYENTVSCKNDYFSLGLLMNFLYNGKNVLLKTENSASQYKDEYKRLEKKISSMSWDNVFNKMPPKLKSCIPKLMTRDIYSRYDDITEFADSEFFHDPLIKVLNFLDGLPTKSNEEKVVFLDGLVDLLPQFPNIILQKKILPVLLELMNLLCTENPVDKRCINKNLEIVLKIGATVSQLSFSEKILAVMSDESNFKILLENATDTLVDNLETLKDRTKNHYFIGTILNPLLTYTLQDNTSDNTIAVQEKILSKIDLILYSYDFIKVKNFLLPLLSKLFVTTTSLTIKISCVGCFYTMVDRSSIDKVTCQEDILPLFKTMKTRDAKILVKSLALFEIVPKLIKDDETLVDQLLPLLWSYSMTSTLGKTDYMKFVKIINKLSSDIQKDHVTKLNDGPSISNMESSKGFTKIIQENETPKREDPDQVASRSVTAPVMNPKKKLTLSETVAPPIYPTRATAGSSFQYPQMPQSKNRYGSNTNRSTITNGDARSLRTVNKSDSRHDYRDNENEEDDDDFDSFVSSTHTSSTPNNIIASPMEASTVPVMRTTSPGSLPPGFSTSLLTPNKKDTLASTMNGSTSTSGSLI
ncbi:hypothetical protein C6P45_002367 [Maudiozyma exigua]|uniref:Protein kinase domain-containing protein n=1 Tax=Maudiozyma exigua TaxID=34358 RepID=A0A9P7BBH8_MAUEX|nr:hypothetical protein C6P45_002367 [Kazachstania exigua]